MIAKQACGPLIPPVTLTVTALNVAVWCAMSFLFSQQALLLHTWGLVPSRFLADMTSGDPLTFAFACLTPISSMFLHEVDWMHVGLNMVFFLLFAPAVEKRLGAARFLGLYLVSGLLANAFYVVMVADGTFESIGASAAVCGVMGAYLLLFLRTRWLKALVPAAVLCLTVRGILDSEVTRITGFSNWMHLAGFAIGAIAAGILTVQVRSVRRA